MTVYAYGATVPLSWSEPPSNATVVVYVTAPDGTESSPATSYVSSAWTASVTGNQYGQWLFTWVSSGTFTGTETDSFQVGGPWYTTMAMLRQALGMASSDTTRDSALALALDGASRSVEKHCDSRVFTLDSAATARVFPAGDRTICTPLGQRVPVNDIGSTTDLAVQVGDGTTWTTITDYELWPDNALVRNEAITAILSDTVSFTAYRRIRVTAKWGWPDTPSAVEQATLLQATRLYRRKDSPEGVAGSAEWGLVRVPNLDPDVKALLAPFTSGWLGA